MIKWMLTLTALAALAVPAVASADLAPADKGTAVDGKAIALQGHLFLRAELSGSATAKPVRLAARAGFVRFVDLGGDMKVQCDGKGPDHTRQNDKGQTVVICVGRGGALVTGSHFGIHGFAMRYGIAIPDGYTGTVKGRVKEWDGNDDSLAQGDGGSTTGPAAAPGQSDGAKAVSTIDAALAGALAKK
jgi:hypothetical protein